MKLLSAVVPDAFRKSPRARLTQFVCISLSLGFYAASASAQTETTAEPVVVTGTRLPVPLDQSPAAVTVIKADELSQRQTDRVADALRSVPGLAVVQSGAPGQLTSVFTRGLKSEHTQVLLDGVPINQGLAGAFDFADLTADNIARIEVERGPQSTLYGPRALAGAIQLFTQRGDQLDPARAFALDVSAEAGSFSTFRERLSVIGALGQNASPVTTTGPSGADKDSVKSPVDNARSFGVFDYSFAASRLDTDNARPNNQYRNTALLTNLGFTPRFSDDPSAKNLAPRLGVIVAYSLSDAGSPNTIFAPRPKDNLLTERQLYAPNLEWQPTAWWHQRLVLSFDKERQVNNPNDDGFVGPTRAQFQRYQLDYQNDLTPVRWLTLTTGARYEQTFVYQLRPFVDQTFGPQPRYLKDFTENAAGFAQLSLTPVKNALLVAGGRFDHFNQFGDVWTYRVAGSYRWEKTGTTVRSSVATGFSPPSPQDKIFGNNFGLNPERDFGYDAGFEQSWWQGKVRVGANYFHNDLSNVIGFDLNGNTFNLGSGRTQGLEAFAQAEPLRGLLLRASYTYLDAVNTSSGDFTNQAPGARLPRRPRNEAFVSIAYRALRDRLTTTLEAKVVNGREDVRFPAPTFQAQNFDLEGYTTLRLLADYRLNEHFRIYGRIENLTDEHYAEVYGYPALGRGYFGGVVAQF
ncbi:MAG: TonB-dependent receptor [Verrucomicrobia bacterium]|nr:TonB-dependent receptor [Verrucomicrobiota bacterium]